MLAPPAAARGGSAAQSGLIKKKSLRERKDEFGIRRHRGRPQPFRQQRVEEASREPEFVKEGSYHAQAIMVSLRLRRSSLGRRSLGGGGGAVAVH